jgi:hypothetical protein
MSVHVLTTVGDKIHEGVVSILEDALAEARAGKITAVLMMVCRPDETETLFSSGMDKVTHKIGALERLKLDLHARAE